ncbi:MAG: 5-oxoproline transporter, DUF979 family subunit, partial [Abiotrophia defectiva]
SYLPPLLVGILLVVMAVLTVTKQVTTPSLHAVSEAVKEERAKRFGLWIFLPSLTLALVVVLLVYNVKGLGGQAPLVIGGLAALVVALIMLRPKPKEVYDGTTQMILQMGVTIILPQLLAALGIIFTKAQVGNLISTAVASVVPAENRLLGVVAYVLGMVVFTMIMGNAFAAFTVITAGIGIPFVFALGANPVVAGTLAMTAGYCGTLMTPMAANFNSMPASLLEMKDPNGVIKQQVPVALAMIVLHIALIYFMAY